MSTGEAIASSKRIGDVEAAVAAQQAGAKKGGIFALGLTMTAILYYALCSSTMLVINKVTIHFLPAPSFVLFCQLVSSAGVVKIGAITGALDVDEISWDKVKSFAWVIVGFLGTIYANIKVLQNSNVETFITFRSSTPLVLCLCDYAFLGRHLPNPRSWACLLVLLAGAAGYVMVDTAFKVEAYAWLAVWYVAFVFDTVYVKHMCESVKMTNWGRVYYTNALAIIPLMCWVPFLEKEKKMLMEQVDWTQPTIYLPLAMSCLVGICMSHSAYLLRDTVSATMFTIVGILCKIVTVVINLLIWDKHASLEGIGFLLICVLAGTFYQQSPKRDAVKPHQVG